MRRHGAALPTPFHHLLALYTPRIHRAALGFMGNEEEAHEVAQESLLRAYAARGRYDASRPFYPWLYTILRNRIRDAKRRGVHRALPGLETERLVSADPSALESLSAKQSRAAVWTAMQGLSDEHREILVMRHFQDLSYAEMTEMLGLPKGTVMSRLFRARKALVAVMKEAP